MGIKPIKLHITAQHWLKSRHLPDVCPMHPRFCMTLCVMGSVSLWKLTLPDCGSEQMIILRLTECHSLSSAGLQRPEKAQTPKIALLLVRCHLKLCVQFRLAGKSFFEHFWQTLHLNSQHLYYVWFWKPSVMCSVELWAHENAHFMTKDIKKERVRFLAIVRNIWSDETFFKLTIVNFWTTRLIWGRVILPPLQPWRSCGLPDSGHATGTSATDNGRRQALNPKLIYQF